MVAIFPCPSPQSKISCHHWLVEAGFELGLVGDEQIVIVEGGGMCMKIVVLLDK